jgi:hypothetical protein
MRPDKLPNPRKPKLRKIALLMPTFGHSGHSVIGLIPTPVRQQKSQDPSGLQPGSGAFKNPQPVRWQVDDKRSRLSVLMAAQRLNRFLEFFSRPKRHFLAGLDLNGLTRRRITACASRPRFHLKNAEAAHTDPSTLLEMCGHGQQEV